MSGPAFDYTPDFKTTDFRQRPDLYRVGTGEQGVLLVEPYKGQILPHCKFKTVAEAKRSSAKIYGMFLAYLRAEGFPGADMARKFLQMGWTRARRYIDGWWREGDRACVIVRGIEHAKGDDESPARNEETVITY